MVRLAGWLAAMLLAAQAAAAPAERPWRVLILNDGDPTLPAFAVMDRALRAALTAPGRHPVDFFYESLDMLRFPPAQFEAALLPLMEKKYAALPLDAVVAIGPPSLDFAEKHSARLWPRARIVFTGVAIETLRGRTLGPNTTGFPRRHDLAGVADLALRLRPSTRRLLVITGTGEFDRMMAGVAREQLAGHAKRLEVEHWEAMRMDEVLRRVGQLGPDDAVMYLGMGRDADGRIFTPAEATTPISAASRAPVYVPIETFIGRGAAAGMVYSFSERGRRIGELVHEVLSSRPAPVPPPTVTEPPSCMADARQLERFSLDASLLPPGCEVRFLPPSLWREYRWHVLAALLVILVQSALILGLVLQRRQVRHGRTELAQASRLALAGELTASIAHEINQPLGAILANAGAAEAILRRDPAANAELRAILADIREADVRASEIIRRVRSLVTSRQAERAPVVVDALIREVLVFLRGDALRRGVVVDAELAPELPAPLADRVQLQQAVVNLCVNAMEAMTDCAAGSRRLGVRTAAVKGGIEIAVSDTGPGIPAAYLPKVFDSFFTTKAQGTGLGLAITRTIVEAHGGSVSAENRDGGGALFRITVPA